MDFRDEVSPADLEEARQVLLKIFTPHEVHLWGEVVRMALRSASLTHANWDKLHFGQGVTARTVVPLADNSSMVFYLRSQRHAPVLPAVEAQEPWLPENQ